MIWYKISNIVKKLPYSALAFVATAAIFLLIVFNIDNLRGFVGMPEKIEALIDTTTAHGAIMRHNGKIGADNKREIQRMRFNDTLFHIETMRKFDAVEKAVEETNGVHEEFNRIEEQMDDMRRIFERATVLMPEVEEISVPEFSAEQPTLARTPEPEEEIGFLRRLFGGQ